MSEKNLKKYDSKYLKNQNKKIIQLSQKWFQQNTTTDIS